MKRSPDVFRPARPSERNRMLRYPRREPEFNIFLIGDLLSYGLSSRAARFFVLERAGKCQAVLMRHSADGESLHVYAPRPISDPDPIASWMRRFMLRRRECGLLGKSEIVRPLIERIGIKPSVDEPHLFAVCRKLRAQTPAAWPIERANVSDAKELAALISAALQPQDSTQLARSISSGRRVVALAREPRHGRIVCTASRVAGTDSAAMIIAVATHPRYRHRGLASACVADLVRELHREKKAAALFYHSPVAGDLYRRMGFRDMGGWTFASFRRATAKTAAFSRKERKGRKEKR